MECKFLLCLLMVFCTIKLSYTGDNELLLAKLKNEIIRSRNLVTTLVSHVERIRLDLQTSTSSQMRASSNRSENVITSLIETVKHQIHQNADTIKPKAKFPTAVRRCVSSADQKLKAINQNHFKKIATCHNDTKQIADHHLHLLHSRQDTGKQYITQLDNIIPNCQASNEFKVVNCIRVLLRNINRLIRDYQSNISILKKDAEKSINVALTSQNTCNSETISTSRKQIKNVKDEAIECLKKA